jgi:hypothetical protein
MCPGFWVHINYGGDFCVKKIVEKSIKMCKYKSIKPIKMCKQGGVV